MLPDGYSDIMLNFGKPYTVLSPDGTTKTISGHALFGQRTSYLLLDQPGRINMIGIRLKPGSEYCFSGIHAKKLVNNAVSLPAFASAEIRELDTVLGSTTRSNEAKVPVIDELLLLLLKLSHSEPNSLTGRAAELILSKKGNISIEEMLAEINISGKQAERYFSKHIGLSPKRFIRVHRFYNAFVQVRSLKKADWMDVLHNCGYYDQSHFIKDFRFFSGESPTRQLLENNTLDHLFGFR